MRLLLRFTGIVLCAGVLLGNTQCQQSGNAQINPPTGTPPKPVLPGNGPDFVTNVTIEDGNGNVSNSFTQGEEIQFVVSVRNRTNTEQSVNIQVCGPYAAMAVVDAGTADVVATGYTPELNCQAVNLDGTPLAFAPGQTMTYTIQWNQQMYGSGNPVPPGNYEVMGGIYCWNAPSATNPAGGWNTTDCMAHGAPSASELTPTQFRSELTPFTIQ